MLLTEWRRRAAGMPLVRLAVVWTYFREWCYVLLFVFYRLRVHGRERVPRTGPLLYVSNHQSHFDPPIIGMVATDRPCVFLARSTLFRFPPFGALLRFVNSVPLDRERGSAGAIRTALAELEAGRCVLVFPEGTRTRDGAVAPFHGGAMLLLRKTKARVVPIAIEGAYDIWPHGRTLPRHHGRILAQVGEPIDADTLLAMKPDAALEHLRETIDEMRRTLRERMRRDSKGRYPVRSAP